MGRITMSCREQPSEAFSPALPRLQKNGRGNFYCLWIRDFHSPHTGSSCPAGLCTAARRSYCQVEETAVWFQVPSRFFLLKWLQNQRYGGTKPNHSTQRINNRKWLVLLMRSTLQKRKMDAESEWCSFAVLKVLPWLFHHISSFCALANEFNDPNKK